MNSGTFNTNPHSHLTIWQAPVPRMTVAVIRMKLDLRCLSCGKSWGLWVQNEALPPDWDKCRECEQKKREQIRRQTSRQISDSYKADITGRRKEQ